MVPGPMWNPVEPCAFPSLPGSFNHAVAASLQQSALHCSSVPWEVPMMMYARSLAQHSTAKQRDNTVDGIYFANIYVHIFEDFFSIFN